MKIKLMAALIAALLICSMSMAAEQEEETDLTDPEVIKRIISYYIQLDILTDDIVTNSDFVEGWSDFLSTVDLVYYLGEKSEKQLKNELKHYLKESEAVLGKIKDAQQTLLDSPFWGRGELYHWLGYDVANYCYDRFLVIEIQKWLNRPEDSSGHDHAPDTDSPAPVDESFLFWRSFDLTAVDFVLML